MARERKKKKFLLTPNEKRYLQKVFGNADGELPERTLSDVLNMVSRSEQAERIRAYIKGVMKIEPRFVDVRI